MKQARDRNYLVCDWELGIMGSRIGIGTLVVVMGCLAAMSLAAQEPLGEEERAKLIKERDGLRDQVLALDKQGQTAKAIAKAEEMIALERRIYGDTHRELIGSYSWLAPKQEQSGELQGAKNSWSELVRLREALLGARHWQTANARVGLARVEVNLRLSPAEVRRIADASAKVNALAQAAAGPQLTAAIQAAEKAAETIQQFYGDPSSELAQVYEKLAWAYKRNGERAKAERRFNDCLERNEKVLGGEHPDLAFSLIALTNFYEGVRRETFTQQALAIRQRAMGNDDWVVALCLQALGIGLVNRGEYGRAEPMVRQAMEIYGRVLGEGHEEHLRSMSTLASIYQDAGETGRAVALHERLLGVLRKARGAEHAEVAATLERLAIALRAAGNYSEAEARMREAVALDRKVWGESHEEYAQGLSNLAAMYIEMADYARAEPLLRKAIEITREQAGSVTHNSALNNLAWIFDRSGKLENAKTLYEQAAEAARQRVGANHPEYAGILANLAGVCDQLDEDQRAEELHRQAMQIRRANFGDQHPLYSESLHNLGLFYLNRGDFQRAEPLYQQAAEILKKARGEKHLDYTRVLSNLAAVYQGLGKFDESADLQRKLLQISRENLNLAASTQSERQQLAMLASVKHQLHGMLSLCVRDGKYLATTFEEVLAWKGLVLGRQRAMRVSADEQKIAPLASELRLTIARLSAVSAGRPGPAEADAWRAQLASLSSRKEELERELTALAGTGKQASVTGIELSKMIPPDCVLVDFLFFRHWQTTGPDIGNRPRWDDWLAAFILHRDGTIYFADYGRAQPVEEAIETWRKDQGGSPEGREAGEYLGKKLWEPLAPHLGDAQTVLISTDGALGKLPFGALPGKQPGSCLLEEKSIAVIPAPQTLITWGQEQRGATEGGRMLIVAGVDYDNRGAAAQPPTPLTGRGGARAPLGDGGESFTPLPGTAAELEAISRKFQENHGAEGLKVIQKSAATTDAVVAEAPKHAYLHFATHGYFAAPQFKSALEVSTQSLKPGELTLASDQSLGGYHPGLLSGLALTGANKPQGDDDGILTAEEVGTLNLRASELVVLSACETGLGSPAGGEGLLGLQRAFQKAGAETVVASLWSVPDEATKMLMVRFYENLWKKKMGKLEALREAQLWMMKEGAEQPGIRRELEARGLVAAGNDREADASRSPKRLPPYYWGAWVLSGDWR